MELSRQEPPDPQKWRQSSRGPGAPPRPESPLTTCSVTGQRAGGWASPPGAQRSGGDPAQQTGPPGQSPLQSHRHPRGGLAAAPLPRPSAVRPSDGLDLVPGSPRVRLETSGVTATLSSASRASQTRCLPECWGYNVCIRVCQREEVSLCQAINMMLSETVRIPIQKNHRNWKVHLSLCFTFPL